MKEAAITLKVTRRGNPQHVAPHPQHQAAFAATALNQQQAGAPSSFVNFSTILNQKDSRWLQLEVCREFQRNKCSRPDVECKFAHPGSAIEIQSGKVTACYDSIKVNKYYFLSAVRLVLSFDCALD